MVALVAVHCMCYNSEMKLMKPTTNGIKAKGQAITKGLCPTVIEMKEDEEVKKVFDELEKRFGKTQVYNFCQKRLIEIKSEVMPKVFYNVRTINEADQTVKQIQGMVV